MPTDHPAFPQPINPSITEPDDPWNQGMGGLTVREYFAARAPVEQILESLPDDLEDIATALSIETEKFPTDTYERLMDSIQVMVEVAYIWADEMIKRGRKP